MRDTFIQQTCDAIVVGAGHAGCEAALALSRMGKKTVLITLNLDAVALMACNPAIGGTSKGHLVREVDALGGEMGRCIDATFLQSRMINTKKGPAVHSLRAQADKREYSTRMLKTLQSQENLILVQGDAAGILVEKGRVCGVELTCGAQYLAEGVVLCCGVYLNSWTITGEARNLGGPCGLQRSEQLAGSLEALGMKIMRFKTGTPPRVDGNTIDYDKMAPQPGDDRIVPFSFLTEPESLQGKEQALCYLTYTNERTHEIIRQNLTRSPMFSGMIQGTGARYCPSIEDKIHRFADKDRHQLFIEPEGNYTNEKYIQGFSTSLPIDVQQKALNTVAGMEHARIVRPGYAIEYDCIDATQLDLSLMAKHIGGLFFAGQICGSSGYEEAAAQGIYAGINCALYLEGREPLRLKRSEAYIGVLVDDLVTKGTCEPYRMMTARAEHRLLLRQDNADLRLTQKGYDAGLVTQARYMVYQRRRDAIAAELERIQNVYLNAAQAQVLSTLELTVPPGASVEKVLSYGSIGYDALIRAGLCDADLPRDVQEQVAIAVKYRGYILRQQKEVEKLAQMEDRLLPEDIDYMGISALRIEARQKLSRLRPQNLGQASRISGVSPADIAVLTVYLTKKESEHGVS